MQIDVITIDFWNTLFDSSNGIERNAFRVNILNENLKLSGIEFEQSELAEAIRSSWGYFNKIWLNEQRTPPTTEIIEFLWDYLNLSYNSERIEAIANAFAECIIDFSPKLIIGVKDALNKFSQNYKLAIISDTGFSPGKILRRLLVKENIFDNFSEFSFSDETGFAKPHPQAYMTILNKLECSPKRALHIGDIEKTDIAGAKGLGMMAIKFNGDPTAILAPEKTNGTIADVECNDWGEIVEIIENRLNHD
jgi:putative hydrolase of the HAD superfamily